MNKLNSKKWLILFILCFIPFSGTIAKSMTSESTSVSTYNSIDTLTIVRSIKIFDGKWQTKLTNSDSLLITFETKKGIIVNVEISATTTDGSAMGNEQKTHVQIIENKFVFTEGEGKDSTDNRDYIKFILNGTFDSETACHGTLKFPEGYFGGDESISPEYNIFWDAELCKQAP